jgi:hypothetical protein
MDHDDVAGPYAQPLDIPPQRREGVEVRVAAQLPA